VAGDETPYSGSRRGASDGFDEIETRAVKTVTKWVDGLTPAERASFAEDHRMAVAHVVAHNKAVAAAPGIAAEKSRGDRFKKSMRYTAAGLGIALLQIGVSLWIHAPQTVIVKLPSGSQVVVTPAAAPTPTPGPTFTPGVTQP
jgi:hypothetical protein